MIRKTFLFAAALILATGAASSGLAHTISLGFLNSGPGSVTFWGGSYHGSGEGLNSEGSMDLSGVMGTIYGPVNQSFSGGIVTSAPAGLIDGVNNFYANNGSDPSGLMVNTNTTGLTVAIWQSITFTGLVPGTYQFDFNDLNTTVRFAAWDDSLSSAFTLSGQIVNPDPSPVPEPATFVLLGLGLTALAGVARRKAGGRATP